MKGLGSILMALGLLIGVITGVLMLAGVAPAGLSWLATVAITKLAFVASGGLMAAGAFVHRLGKRLTPSLPESTHPTPAALSAPAADQNKTL